MSKAARRITSIGMIFLAVNFFLMIGLAMKHGASAFPGGIKDESGSYVIDHGKRVDFSAPDYRFSYYQAMVTWIAFPAYFIAVLVLYATGGNTEKSAAQGGGRDRSPTDREVDP